jgi:hypothetical protein
LKPVVAVPLWLAVPIYVIYTAIWVALVVLAMALAAAAMIGYVIVGLARKSQARRLDS